MAKKNTKFFIGEIGIDGGKIKKTFPLEKQIEIFVRQMAYADQNNLFVHVHCVYEWDKLFKILNEGKFDNLIKNRRIILHSFQGKVKHVNKFSQLNCYFSISSGCFITKNYEMLKAVPLDKLLFESDAPSMFNKEVYDDESEYNKFYSENNRVNSPESIVYLNRKYAKLLGIDEDKLREVVKNNVGKIIGEIYK